MNEGSSCKDCWLWEAGQPCCPNLSRPCSPNPSSNDPSPPKFSNEKRPETDPFTDTVIEVKLSGANGVQQVISVTGTEYIDTAVRRNWTTLNTGTDVISIKSVSRKVDPNHEEITLTVTANGKTSTTKRTMPVPRTRISGEDMSDDELIRTILTPKLGGAK